MRDAWESSCRSERRRLRPVPSTSQPKWDVAVKASPRARRKLVLGPACVRIRPLDLVPSHVIPALLARISPGLIYRVEMVNLDSDVADNDRGV